MIIVMFGAPGVGKGTIANLLAKKHKLEVISASGVLKEECKKKSKAGKIIEKHIQKGTLVPSKYIIPLMVKAIKKAKSKNVILDGFPRRLDQMKEFEKYKKIDVVLDLRAPQKIILERLSGRRVCPKCKTIYHIKYMPPKKKGVCDKDGTKLIHRVDDKPKVIKHRLEVYKEETLPLEKYFVKKKILKTIDASDNPKNILKRIEKVLHFK